MERLCFTFDIRPGTEAEYKKRHDEIWPDLAEAIRDAGFSNYTCFRRGLQVIYYGEFEPDAATAFAKLNSHEVTRRWGKWFEEIIVSLVDDDGNLFLFEEVWHLDDH